jgi:tRNA nucleotidyltransferase (CCA-adding enzyme)
MRDATILDVLEACDAFRRPDRFERLLLACEADARGRGPELRQRPYRQAEIMRGCLRAAAAVRLSPEVLQQHAGPAIAQLMRDARINAIGDARR